MFFLFLIFRCCNCYFLLWNPNLVSLLKHLSEVSMAWKDANIISAWILRLKVPNCFSMVSKMPLPKWVWPSLSATYSGLGCSTTSTTRYIFSLSILHFFIKFSYFFFLQNFIWCEIPTRSWTNRVSMVHQIATNTLERVAPLTHAVGNVLKRVFVIGFSIIVFGKIETFFFI